MSAGQIERDEQGFAADDGSRRALGALTARIDPNAIGLPIALVALIVAFAISAPNFLTVNNQLNNLQNAAFVGIIAFGMTLVIIAGEIDISVGSAVALGSAMLGVLTQHAGLPLGVAVVLVLLEGALIGALGGAIRAFIGVPSFIVTLALYTGLAGLALLITNALPISIEADHFSFWGSGRVAGIPVPALVLIAVFLLFWFIARKTVFGRSVYAVGGNAEAARLSGLPVAAVRVAIFAITGLLAAAVAILESARLSAGDPTIGVGLEFQVISAVIIGGTSLMGGRGSIVGTALGVLFITILANGMVLLGINNYAQQVVQGGVILVGVLVSQWRVRTRATR
ncbi:ABC transporter permease [Conexibacter sp. CPCC 206217]|uniref:ABC transporter permease n=1 Tax=Conexibacter sp. CPCC 206217 TaxID=3064574 RepID=UPI002716CF59|nr:ABC transporter permease [Conexibacter sp. CPCC 206217]MDO8209633.1 ABC transporter permease [Conexibacter sp. CPCC 206217]